MAWEWSYSADGIDAVRKAIFGMESDTLREIYAEWREFDNDKAAEVEFDEAAYNDALDEAADLPADTLASYVFDRAAGAAVCENGAHSAWACPHGCGCHLAHLDD